MEDNKPGVFQRRELEKTYESHELIIPPNAEEVLNNIFFEKTEIRGFDKKDGEIMKDVEKTYQELSEEGFTRGRSESTKSVITFLTTAIGAVRYGESPITYVPDSKEGMEDHLNCIIRAGRFLGGKPSFFVDKHMIELISNPNKIEECFKDEIREKIKNEVLEEALQKLPSVMLKLMEKGPDFSEKLPTPRYLFSILIIHTIERIEKSKKIRVLKEDKDLWKVLGIPRRSYQEKSKEVKTIFGSILDELFL